MYIDVAHSGVGTRLVDVKKATLWDLQATAGIRTLDEPFTGYVVDASTSWTIAAVIKRMPPAFNTAPSAPAAKRPTM